MAIKLFVNSNFPFFPLSPVFPFFERYGGVGYFAFLFSRYPVPRTSPCFGLGVVEKIGWSGVGGLAKVGVRVGTVLVPFGVLPFFWGVRRGGKNSSFWNPLLPSPRPLPFPVCCIPPFRTRGDIRTMSGNHVRFDDA